MKSIVFILNAEDIICLSTKLKIEDLNILKQCCKKQRGKMDEESSLSKEKTWGFRRSTIARREFLEAVGTVISVPPATRGGGRQSRGRGRARGRGRTKQDIGAGVVSASHKRSNRGRKSALSVLVHSDEKSDKDEEQCRTDGQLCVATELISISEGRVSDRAEDSDDLTLTEIRKRAMSRQLEQLKCEDSDFVKDVEEYNAEGTQLQVECNEVNMLDVSTDLGTIFSSPARGETESFVTVFAETAKKESAEEASADNCEEDCEKMDGNVFCCICQQTHTNRLMFCCDTCRKWFHGDCVGISESDVHLLQKNGELYICSTCSEDQNVIRKIKNANKISTFSAEEVMEEPRSVENEVKEEISMLEEVVEDAPKCIGPGCSNNALPESVYCGHQCIVQHAATAMKGLSESKTETKPAVAPTKPLIAIPKRSFLAKLFKVKISETPTCEENENAQKIMNDESVCCAPLTDFSHSSDVENQSTIKDKEEQSTDTQSKPSDLILVNQSAEKIPVAPVIKKSTPGRARKTMPGSPRLENLRGGLSKSKQNTTLATEDNKPPDVLPVPDERATVPPSSPLQIRQKIRRSLTEVLLYGIKNSDHLDTSGCEVGKLSVNIEKEVFNMCYTTDDVYKNKCQHLLRNLKNPKNKELCHQLLKGEISPMKVIHLSEKDIKSVEDTAGDSLEDHQMSVEEESDPVQVEEAPAVQVEEAPAVQVEEAPALQVEEAPAVQVEVEEASAMRVEKAPAMRVEEAAAMRVEEAAAMRVEEAAAMRVEKAPAMRVEEAPAMRVEEAPAMRVEEAPAMRVEEAPAMRVEEAPAMRVEEAPAMRVEEAPAMRVEEAPAVHVKSGITNSYEKSCPSRRKQTEAKKLNSGAPDMICGMLKDTTSEHKCHLFDLNCRICTGQVSTDGEAETKNPNTEMTKDKTEEKSLSVVQMKDEASPPAAEVSSISESPASPSADDPETHTPSVDCTPVLIPSTPVVSLSRRDPRTAQFRHLLPSNPDPKFVSPQSQLSTPGQHLKEPLKETRVVPPLVPKSILMKPSSASGLSASYGSSTRLMESHTPSDKGTKQFLSKQEPLWKGFLNMPTVAKFVTKGYLISGSPDFLKEDLPDTILIGGRILPQTVWEYVELIKTSEAKEMSLIRFHPSSEEEEVAYVSLFSYFNSRRRFGVVSNICKRIKDLYLIPLCAKQSIPAAFLPIEGPGLEQNHPNLLIGLVVCQKPKRLEAFLQEVGEKKSRVLIRSDSKEANNPTSLKALKVDIGQHNTTTCDPDALAKTLPNLRGPSSLFVSPGPLYSSISQSGPSTHSSASLQKPISADPPRDATGSTPLQTILSTLFGQRTQNPAVKECEMSLSTDKVQHFQQTCKEAVNSVELSDDRPYDPEEYDPALPYDVLDCNVPTTLAAADDDDRPYDPEEEYNAVDKGGSAKNNLPKASKATNTQDNLIANSDVAYDPEDETVFEEMQSYLTGNVLTHNTFTICEQASTSDTNLSEQQKILEELNRQIEEQKRQLEEQTETLRLQKEAIGVSMAHFSVSHALMSPPPNFGRDEDGEMENLPYPTTINSFRDPWICQETSKDVEDASEVKIAAQPLLNTEENQTEVLDTSATSKKENLEYDKTLANEGSPDRKTEHLQNTTGSRSEYSSRTRDRRSSEKRSSHERRSHHRDRASSRAPHKSKDLKDDLDKDHMSRRSSKHLSRQSRSDRKRSTSSRTSRHHHRDSPYKRRSEHSTRSHSSRRERTSRDDNDQSQRTDQQQPRPSVHYSGPSGHDCVQGPGSNEMLDETVCFRKKQVVEGQQCDFSNPKHQKGSSQTPATCQILGDDSQNDNAFGRNQLFSSHSEMKINNLPLSKIDCSSEQGASLSSPFMQNVKTAQPLNNTAPPQIQIDVPHLDSASQYIEMEAPSRQPPCNQTARFSDSNHMNQERGPPSMQKKNNLSSLGDCPQRSFQSQHRDFPHSNNSQLKCKNESNSEELTRKKRREFSFHEADRSKQLKLSDKQEGFTTCELDKSEKQMYPNHIRRKILTPERTNLVHQGSKQSRPPQSQECNVQEPEIFSFQQNKGQPYVKGQRFQGDESSQFQQRGSLLGPGDRDNFRILHPQEHFQPQALNTLCFDKSKPSREPLSMGKFGQPKNSNTSTSVPSQSIQSSRSGPFQHGLDSHSSSGQIRHGVTGPMTLEEPSEGQFNNRDAQLSHCNSPKRFAVPRQFNNEPFDNRESNRPHLNNTKVYATFEQFNEGHHDYRGFSHKHPKRSRGHVPQHDQPSGEDAEDSRTQTCLPKHSQKPTCEESHSLFEGHGHPEIRGQSRGPHRSGLRGQNRGNVETHFARGHDMRAQMRGPRFDSPQQFMGQKEPSPNYRGQRRRSPQNRDSFEEHHELQSSGFPSNSVTTLCQFNKPEHQNTCEIQSLWQPLLHFERAPGQTNIRPLRLSGPLLPTPLGCRIRPNTPRLQRPNLHSECDRSSMRQHPITNDITGPWVHGERPSIGHSIKPQQSDHSESLNGEEQRIGYEGRRGQQSVQPCSYRGARERNSIRRRARKRPHFGKISHNNRETERDL
ncbi:death-inducer obliterator 1 isoform X2 [Paramisgurnus dabryanus]|uniref:death-inducer obliterator 1 isoform X2 n=1 Tax=Paramisgurnus dabryanus TaxID=90735 RepID=UPI0031F3DAC3